MRTIHVTCLAYSVGGQAYVSFLSRKDGVACHAHRSLQLAVHPSRRVVGMKQVSVSCDFSVE